MVVLFHNHVNIPSVYVSLAIIQTRSDRGLKARKTPGNCLNQQIVWEIWNVLSMEK